MSRNHAMRIDDTKGAPGRDPEQVSGSRPGQQAGSPRLGALRSLSDDSLIVHGDEAVRREHATGLRILEVLVEIDRRLLHLECGYSSLYDYCVRRWNYSRSKAARSIAAARAIQRHPRLHEMLASRSLTLSAAARLASVLTAQNADELLDRAGGRSYAEIDALVAGLLVVPPVADRVRPIGVSRGPLDPRGPLGASTGELPLAVTFHSQIGSHGGAMAKGDASGPRDAPGPGDATVTPEAMQAPAVEAPPSGPIAAGCSTGSVATGSDDATDPCVATPAEVRPSSAMGQTAAELALTPEAGPALTPEAETSEHSPAADDSPIGSDLPGTGRGSSSQSASDAADPRFEIRFTAGPGFVEKLERARRLCSSRPGLAGVLEKALDELIARHDPAARQGRRARRRERNEARQAGRNEIRQAARNDHRAAPTPPAPTDGGSLARTGQFAEPARRPSRPGGMRSRHVPAMVRDEVRLRDGGRCTFVGPDGIRCGATTHLQIDHIRPFALGGGHDAENLRLRCGAHNRFTARQTFGDRALKAT